MLIEQNKDRLITENDSKHSRSIHRENSSVNGVKKDNSIKLTSEIIPIANKNRPQFLLTTNAR